MSKIFRIFILCYKCIFWCWWARGVCENVSRVLQTRKTVKIAWCYKYKWASATVRHFTFMPSCFWTAQTKRPPEKAIRSQKLSFGYVHNIAMCMIPCQFEVRSFTQVGVSLSGSGVILWLIFYKSLGFMTCLCEPNHMPGFYKAGHNTKIFQIWSPSWFYLRKPDLY